MLHVIVCRGGQRYVWLRRLNGTRTNFSLNSETKVSQLFFVCVNRSPATVSFSWFLEYQVASALLQLVSWLFTVVCCRLFELHYLFDRVSSCVVGCSAHGRSADAQAATESATTGQQMTVCLRDSSVFCYRSHLNPARAAVLL